LLVAREERRERKKAGKPDLLRAALFPLAAAAVPLVAERERRRGGMK
jgi:hypothetical protein